MPAASQRLRDPSVPRSLHLPINGPDDLLLRLSHTAVHRASGSCLVSASSQTGAGSAGVQIRGGAQGYLALPRLQFPDGGRVAHPLNLAHEGGDVLRVVLGCLGLGHHLQGDGGHRHRAAVVQLHSL